MMVSLKQSHTRARCFTPPKYRNKNEKKKYEGKKKKIEQMLKCVRQYKSRITILCVIFHFN